MVYSKADQRTSLVPGWEEQQKALLKARLQKSRGLESPGSASPTQKSNLKERMRLFEKNNNATKCTENSANAALDPVHILNKPNRYRLREDPQQKSVGNEEHKQSDNISISHEHINHLLSSPATTTMHDSAVSFDIVAEHEQKRKDEERQSKKATKNEKKVSKSHQQKLERKCYDSRSKNEQSVPSLEGITVVIDPCQDNDMDDMTDVLMYDYEDDSDSDFSLIDETDITEVKSCERPKSRHGICRNTTLLPREIARYKARDKREKRSKQKATLEEDEEDLLKTHALRREWHASLRPEGSSTASGLDCSSWMNESVTSKGSNSIWMHESLIRKGQQASSHRKIDDSSSTMSLSHSKIFMSPKKTRNAFESGHSTGYCTSSNTSVTETIMTESSTLVSLGQQSRPQQHAFHKLKEKSWILDSFYTSTTTCSTIRTNSTVHTSNDSFPCDYSPSVTASQLSCLSSDNLSIPPAIVGGSSFVPTSPCYHDDDDESRKTASELPSTSFVTPRKSNRTKFVPEWDEQQKAILLLRSSKRKNSTPDKSKVESVCTGITLRERLKMFQKHTANDGISSCCLLSPVSEKKPSIGRFSNFKSNFPDLAE